jgi:methylenetetrahydrofolate reductase (NADPH)
MTATAVHSPNAAGADYARIAAELAACGSLEMNADRAGDAAEIAAHLPVGTRVYVNHLPRHDFADSLAALVALRRAGLEPVPHIAARRIESRFEVQRFVERAVAEAGASKALVIAGDTTPPRGPYADGAALLRDGVLAAAGIREIGLPGYPEGHPSIPVSKLEAAMDEKLALARQQGMGAYVLTQFSFAPARIVEYCTGLARRAPSVPVYVGLAGPTDPVRLLRFAQRCGVSASLRALRSQGFGAIKLITHTDPAEQLVSVARYCAGHNACNVVGVHLFSFGGVSQAAAWMNRALNAAA